MNELLIRVGIRTIVLSSVQEFRRHKNGIDIVYNQTITGTYGEMTPVIHGVTGEEADALDAWLENNSANVVRLYQKWVSNEH